jgi:type II secretory pathway component GspD/PulD (secretin)
MKILSIILSFLSCFAFSQAESPQVQVESRFLEYAADDAFAARVQAQLADSNTGIVTAAQLAELLVEPGNADILSAPNVTALSGQEAEIKVVEERFFEPEVATEIGVSLALTPTVVDSGIQLDVRARIVEFLGFKDADSSPILRARIIERKIMLPDGHAVLLPGPAYESTTVIEDCVPVLGSIPLLGRLFRCSRTETTTRNLLLTISAKQIQP